jgi:soluble lytic murein transglycosylase
MINDFRDRLKSTFSNGQDHLKESSEDHRQSEEKLDPPQKIIPVEETEPEIESLGDESGEIPIEPSESVETESVEPEIKPEAVKNLLERWEIPPLNTVLEEEILKEELNPTLLLPTTEQKITPDASVDKKTLKKPFPWLVGGGILLIMGGITLVAPKAIDWVENQQQQQVLKTLETESNQPSEVLKLATLAPEKREEQLKAIATQSESSLERSRAKYLLAADLLKAYKGGEAIQLLENLEQDYPLLAPYILLKRGRGYELSNEKIKAQETWQEILKKYPDSPVAVDALDLLGRSDSKYWDQAIAEHPTHPRTLEILHQRLKKDPQSVDLMRQIIKTSPDDSSTPKIRTVLVKDHAEQLTPQDWTAIADSYWQQREYGKALSAYAKAEETPQNLYRLARSQQIQDKKTDAIKNYQLLIERYPNLPETAQSLRRLAALTPPPQAIAYLDQLIQKFPEDAPNALLKKANLLDKIDPNLAQKTRETLLKDYSSSEAAAEYRWSQAQKQAKAGDLVKAWEWAQQLTQANPDSAIAPKATFWIGKWAQQLNRPEDAKAAFENVLARYPHSYFAWRAAVLSGWQVGDFNSVRFLQPKIVMPTTRPLPTAGSDMFKELYRLGQDKDAIALFEAEMSDKKELDVYQSFTDALLKLTQGDYLAGINQVLNLRDFPNPQHQKQWQTLRQTPDYWQALFPFPYKQSILDWSEKRQLNPLLVASLIRQESRFEKEIRSPVGATGLMQVMPSTADWIAPQIDLKKFSLTNPQDNINMGTWYFQHTHDEYSNNSALAVASYNAGPGNVAKWLKEYQGSDPDLFIEKIPFSETKNYVESVFSNYWNYMRIYNPEVSQLLSHLPK